MQKKSIVSDPAVMMGKPVIAGTRITVELILDKLAADETIEQILDAPVLPAMLFKQPCRLLLIQKVA